MADKSEKSGEKTWERRMEDAKKRHRPKLKDWTRDKFYEIRNKEYQNLFRMDGSELSVKSQSIERFQSDEMSVKQFVTDIENFCKPCVIDNIPTMENWNSLESWSFSNLKKVLGNRLFKVGEDDDGYKIKAKMKYFLKYLQKNEDDSPLYVFDGSFDEDSISKTILSDYKVPKYFRDDLFSLVGEKKRPPYRWFLIGPARSGSCVHIDPLATSAWNTVIRGRKRWVLFPPETPRSIAKGLDCILKGEDDEAINYFVDILPRIRKKHGASVNMIEFIQEQGETVFVPGGWWHGVLNLGDTIAVTQNFCSYSNFEKVWAATRKGRKKMSVKWLNKLEEAHPTLAETAKAMNRRDGFFVNKGGKFEQELSRAVKEPPESFSRSGRRSGSVSGSGGMSGCDKAAPFDKGSDSGNTSGDSESSGAKAETKKRKREEKLKDMEEKKEKTASKKDGSHKAKKEKKTAKTKSKGKNNETK